MHDSSRFSVPIIAHTLCRENLHFHLLIDDSMCTPASTLFPICQYPGTQDVSSDHQISLANHSATLRHFKACPYGKCVLSICSWKLPYQLFSYLHEYAFSVPDIYRKRRRPPLIEGQILRQALQTSFLLLMQSVPKQFSIHSVYQKPLKIRLAYSFPKL